MSEKSKRGLYRGGGRNVDARWNRADQYGSQSTRHGEGTPTEHRGGIDAGQPTDRTGPDQRMESDRRSGPDRHAGTDRARADNSRRYGSRWRPPGTEGTSDPMPADETATPSQGTRDPTAERQFGGGQLSEHRSTGSPVTEQSSQGWQWTGDPQRHEGPQSSSFATSSEWPDVRAQYGRPVGELSEQPRPGGDRRVQRQRSTPANQLGRTTNGEQDRGSAQSGERDSGRQQPRDPETGRFLPKDRSGEAQR